MSKSQSRDLTGEILLIAISLIGAIVGLSFLNYAVWKVILYRISIGSIVWTELIILYVFSCIFTGVGIVLYVWSLIILQKRSKRAGFMSIIASYFVLIQSYVNMGYFNMWDSDYHHPDWPSRRPPLSSFPAPLARR